MYRTTGETYHAVCKALSIRPEIRAIEVMTRNDTIYVRGTVLKPDEARSIAYNCRKVGYVYRGPFAH